MFARHAVPNNSSLSLHLADNHLSLHLASLCFQSLATIKFSNPFVLITIRNAGGWVYSHSASNVTHSRNHLPWCSASVPSALRHPCGDSSLPGLLSTLNFRLWTSASPSECALTGRLELIENTATLSLLESTLTRPCAVTPVEATLTKKGGGRVRGLALKFQTFQRCNLLLLCSLFVFSHFHDAPPATLFFSCFCIVAGGGYTP